MLWALLNSYYCIKARYLRKGNNTSNFVSASYIRYALTILWNTQLRFISNILITIDQTQPYMISLPPNELQFILYCKLHVLIGNGHSSSFLDIVHVQMKGMYKRTSYRWCYIAEVVDMHKSIIESWLRKFVQKLSYHIVFIFGNRYQVKKYYIGRFTKQYMKSMYWYPHWGEIFSKI